MSRDDALADLGSAAPALWIVDEESADERLDRHLAERFDRWSRTRIQRWIEDAGVAIDGKPAKPSQRLKLAQTVSILSWPEPPQRDELLAQDIPLAIVYEDDRLAVVDKQAGLSVHPGAGCPDGTLANALAFRYSRLSGVNGPLRPGIVHRLDRDTTGLLVVAKDDEAHRVLSAQLADRTLTRIYDALCWGVPDAGRVEAPIGRDPGMRTRMAVVPDGRAAATILRPIARANPCSLVECRLETGRTHQIRVHLAHVRHPVVGDSTYGGGQDRLRAVAPLDREHARRILAPLARQGLHARRMAFVHPSTGERMEFESAWPDDFRAAVEAAFPLGSPARRHGETAAPAGETASSTRARHGQSGAQR